MIRKRRKNLLNTFRKIIRLAERYRVILPSAVRAETDPHPWKCRLFWNGSEWKLQVHPGYVAGEDVTFLLEAKDAPKATRERTAREEGTKKIRTKGTMRAWLSESPVLPTAWRNIGPDAEGSAIIINNKFTVTFEPVPKYFRALGVGDPPKLIETASGVKMEGKAEGPPPRLLRACDVVLLKDRAAQTTTIEQTTSAGADARVNTVRIGIRTAPNMQRRARLIVTTKWEDPERPTLVSRFRGEAEDVAYDYLRVATLFLLSEPGAAENSAPDAKWTPFVQHHLFYNLQHKTKRISQNLSGDGVKLDLPPALGAGLLSTVGNQLLAPINDAIGNLIEATNAPDPEGKFWSV